MKGFVSVQYTVHNVCDNYTILDYILHTLQIHYKKLKALVVVVKTATRRIRNILSIHGSLSAKILGPGAKILGPGTEIVVNGHV